MSRATLITFPPLKKSIVESYIKEKYPDESERLPFLVNYCEGVPGMADEVLSNEEFEALRGSSLKNLSLLLDKNRLNAFKLEAYINENSANAEMIFDFWISYLRDITILSCGVFEHCINVDKERDLRLFTESYSKKQVLFAVDTLLEGKEMLARYVKPGAVILRCALVIKEYKFSI